MQSAVGSGNTYPELTQDLRHVVRPQGLHRLVSAPRGWVDDDGVPVTDDSTIERLRALHLPPGWSHVWASADPDRPIQATGIDARGRTQYRYSPAAQARARLDKFARLLEFSAALPHLRRRVHEDLLGHGRSSGPLEGSLVTAAVVKLLDKGLFRVGNERYARENHTYGLTTLRRAQVSIHNDTAIFDFVGKEHIEHHLAITDRAVASVVRSLLDQDCAPTQLLFATSYPPHWRRVDSVTVNSYIHTHASVSTSAKYFRTWGATVAAAAVAAGAIFPAKTGRRRRDDLKPFDAAASLLGNTPAVARGAYVHPHAVEAGRTEMVRSAFRDAAHAAASDNLRDVLHDSNLQMAVHDQLVASSGRQDAGGEISPAA